MRDEPELVPRARPVRRAVLSLTHPLLSVPPRQAECVVAQPVRVSGVRLPWRAPLPVGLGQRRRRSPPQRGEEGGGAARGRRLLRRLLLLVSGLVRSYLIAGAGVGAGLVVSGDVWIGARRGVGAARLWRNAEFGEK